MCENFPSISIKILFNFNTFILFCQRNKTPDIKSGICYFEDLRFKKPALDDHAW